MDEIAEIVVEGDHGITKNDGDPYNLKSSEIDLNERINNMMSQKEDTQIKYNCDFVEKFLGELCMANYNIMSAESKDQIKHMKKEMTTFIKFHDQIIEGKPPSSSKPAIQPSKSQVKVSTKQERVESSTEVENDAYDSDEESEHISTKSAVSRNSRSRTKKSDKNRDGDLLRILVERLDNRQVGEHRKYEEGRGQTLEQFMESFEKHCRNGFKEDDDVWVNQLEKHLSGETLEAFKAVTDINDSFDTVKSKLLAWDKDMHESRKKTAKLTFNRATHESGETLFLYSSRLEKLFNLAYPKHKSVEKNSLLIDHYIETLPSYAKQDFTATQRYKRLTGEEMTWSVVQKLARLKDAELKDKKVEESKVEEIVINVQKSKQPDNQKKITFNHVHNEQ